ncbi:MAG: YfhO family protein, partial [Thermomicrobiales bacterium]|nr:YfhO family protein [Thermomicrobiales bacterium]
TLYRLLPMFEPLHSHRPERALIVVYLPLAMLAGAAIDAALRRPTPRRDVLTGIALAATVWAAMLVWSANGGPVVPLSAALAAGAGLLLLAQGAFFPDPARALVPLALAVVVIWDPLHPFLGPPPSALNRTNTPPYDLATQLQPTAAAEWLRDRAAEGRYLGYDPAVVGREGAQLGGYRVTRENPDVWHLLNDDLATLYGLKTIQGYDPAQLRRFSRYIDALNGMVQEYHEANVFPSGIESPLLDPLAVRYLVIPAADRPGLDELLTRYPQVYADEWVRILERPSAFPFAWIVHDLQQAADPSAAIAALAALDLRQTAVLEEPPPAVSAGGSGAAAVLTWEPELIRLRVEADAPGLLVVSQAYEPGWRATVNGAAARVLPVDGALQGVAIPAGVSEVELRYQPWTLSAGLAISLGSATLLLVALAAAMARSRRERPAVT